MKKGFFIYLLITVILIILIVLRIRSLAFPSEGTGRTEVIYLDSFHDMGDIFEIASLNGGFNLKPYMASVRLNDRPVKKTTRIKNDDLISISGKIFLFGTRPGNSPFKQVFQRPLSELLPTPNQEVILGGWPGKSRPDLMTRKSDLQLLKSMAVEISSDLLERLIPTGSVFRGKLMVIRRNEPDGGKTGSGPMEPVQISSPHLRAIRIRNFRKSGIPVDTFTPVRSGDIFRFSNPRTQTELSVKFDFHRVRIKQFTGERGKEKLVPKDITYLLISYLESESQALLRRPYMVFLKSLDTGQYVYLDLNKTNRFIGGRGLFRFGLMPGQLIGRRYIPESVSEGGMADLKEMLDRDFIYRERLRFRPVDLEFLKTLRGFSVKGIRAVGEFFRINHIEWRRFSDRSDLEQFLNSTEKIRMKMIRKGSWDRFCSALEELNDRYALKGVGIGGDLPAFQVHYRTGGDFWSRARNWDNHTPQVDGVDEFFWGDGIQDHDKIEFRFDFDRSPGNIRFISIGRYAFSLDGRNYTNRDFSDGVQDIGFGPDQNRLYVRISGYQRFLRQMAQAGLQMSLQLKTGNSQPRIINTDRTWDASIDLTRWHGVKTNRFPADREPELARSDSIWYDETWNPFFRGTKVRYFRKKFSLTHIPDRASWRIGTRGTYLIWVNQRLIVNESALINALKTGWNTLTVMVSRKGCQKKISGKRLMTLRHNRPVLIATLANRTGLVRGGPHSRFTVKDRKYRVLGFDCQVNGQQRRFFTPVDSGELNAILGTDPAQSWGLEQILGDTRPGLMIRDVQLTIDWEWQKIAIEKIRDILEENRKRETASPGFLQLTERLRQTEETRDRFRRDLMKPENGPAQAIMENLVRLQEQVDNLRSEINKIRNHFYEASVVILNQRGQVLVAASYPFDRTGMEALNPDIRLPYRVYEAPALNRAWKWKYNPGSTAKVLDSIAFLYSAAEESTTSGRPLFPFIRTLLDPGGNFTGIPGSELKGSRLLNGKQVMFQLQNFRGHDIPPGFCSLEQALVHSYNTYFGYVSLHNNRMLMEDSVAFKNDRYFVSKSHIPMKLAYREFPILDFAERLGFNREMDLLGNLEGTVVGPVLRRRPYDIFFAIESVFPVNAYSPSDVAYMSIGQSDLQLTTLQNALVASTILNRGWLYRPSIIQSMKIIRNNRSETVLIPDPQKQRKMVFSAEIAEPIREAMKQVVEQGTAAGVFDAETRKGRTFYAKTGTAETKFFPDNSLFIGFGEFRNGERLVFSVTVPRSGTGAAIAGRLMARIIKGIIELENRYQTGF